MENVKKTDYNIPGFGMMSFKEGEREYIAVKHFSGSESLFINSRDEKGLKEAVIDYLTKLKKDHLTKASELDNILEEAKVNGAEYAFKKYQIPQINSEENK